MARIDRDQREGLDKLATPPESDNLQRYRKKLFWASFRKRCSLLAVAGTAIASQADSTRWVESNLKLPEGSLSGLARRSPQLKDLSLRRADTHHALHERLSAKSPQRTPDGSGTVNVFAEEVSIVSNKSVPHVENKASAPTTSVEKEVQGRSSYSEHVSRSVVAAMFNYCKRGGRYIWGSNDCSVFVSDYLEAMGLDSKRYTTSELMQRGAMEGLGLTRRVGGISQATVGDVLVYNKNGKGHCGVVDAQLDRNGEYSVIHNVNAELGIRRGTVKSFAAGAALENVAVSEIVVYAVPYRNATLDHAR